MKGEIKGVMNFPRCPLKGEMRVFSNHSLFLNKLPLLFNTHALLRIAQTSSSQNLPAVGIIASQRGNVLFPPWECFRCCSIVKADKSSERLNVRV